MSAFHNIGECPLKKIQIPTIHRGKFCWTCWFPFAADGHGGVPCNQGFKDKVKPIVWWWFRSAPTASYDVPRAVLQTEEAFALWLVQSSGDVLNAIKLFNKLAEDRRITLP
jgi:hypothetical protein